jgi:biopolymer transport protein ExbD
LKKRLWHKKTAIPSSNGSVEAQDLLWLLFASMMGIVSMTNHVERIAIPQVNSGSPKSISWQEYSSLEKISMPPDGYARYRDRNFASAEQLLSSLPLEGKSVVIQIDAKRTFEDVVSLKMALEQQGKEVFYEFEKR